MDAYTVAAYYFPQWHVEPRNEAAHGKGWTEWKSLREARPRFPGHVQPKVPLWGEEDESDPTVFAKKIDAAADHGVDVFLFDWYYTEKGKFLAGALEKGYLNAPNKERVKFAVMWANHGLYFAPDGTPDGTPESVSSAVSRETFDAMTDHLIEDYFKRPSYWKIDGCPYFSVYQLNDLMQGLGGVDATRDALAAFTEKTKAAGFPGLHLNAVAWEHLTLPGATAPADMNALTQRLGFTSLGSYVWVHHVQMPDFPETEYEYVMQAYFKVWDAFESDWDLPYQPNVSMGWDASPRFPQDKPMTNSGYPDTPILKGNTPEHFKAALTEARKRLAKRPSKERIVTINSWNEWTEGSYIEPDTVHGMKYLEAIRDVFGK